MAKTMRVGKFYVPKTKKKIKLLDKRPERGGYIIDDKNRKVGRYKLTDSQKKQRRRLRDYLTSVYEINKEFLKEKGIESKETFVTNIYDLMYEDSFRLTQKGYETKPRSAKEALRILSRTETFTTIEERALENVKKNVFNNPELRTELQQIFGPRIQWHKLKWTSTGKGKGYFDIEGSEYVLEFEQRKQKEYRGGKIVKLSKK